MLLILDGILAVGLVLFALAGARRGPWPEVVTLGGLLLGALLADEWGDAWGGDLGGALGFLDGATARLVVRALLFLVPLLVVGYGGALLLPAAGRLALRGRGIGALLGLFNGAAIVAVLLRQWDYSAASASPLRGDPGTLFLLNWAGWFPLVLALGGLVAVVVAVLRRPRQGRAPAPVKPAAPSAALPATRRPGGTPVSLALPGDGSAPSAAAAGPAPLAGRPVTGPAAAAPAVAPAPPKANGATPGGELRCHTCNQLLAPGAAFCPNCGTPVPV